MDKSIDSFGVVSENFKLFKEDKQYQDLAEKVITFDSQSLELENYTNLKDVMQELNEVSRKLFNYGVVYESQNRVLQLLEDEFEVWMAQQYFEVDKIYPLTGAKKRTETEKNNLIITHFQQAFTEYKIKISKEKYKLGIIKRAVSGLENYGFKLHSLKDYNIAANQSR